MRFRTWCTTWLLLALVGMTMATTAYFVKGFAGLIRSTRRMNVGSQAIYTEDNWAFSVSDYVVWIVQAMSVTLLSVLWTQLVAPQAAGSGIPEMRTILSGVVLEDYISLRTLAAKAGGLSLGLGSGLPVGSEGPFVHIACTLANQFMRLPPFAAIAHSDELRRAIMSASCAVGVSTAFDSVFGGIIFSMETTASYFELSSYWNALYCALWGSICMRLWGQTGLFPTAETLTSAWGQYELLEMPIFLLLGGACGLCGALFVRLNEAHQAWRMRHGLHKKLWYSHVAYPLLVSFMTATVCFPEFLGGFMPHGTGTITRLVTLSNLEGTTTQHLHWHKEDIIYHLMIFTVLHFLLTAMSLAIPVPCGVYYPCLNIGAGLGRLVGELLKRFCFPGLEPRLYAIVGAAGFSVGVTRTISTIIILLQITGQFQYVQPILVAVMIAYIIANPFSDSIYESILRIRKLPYLPSLVSFTPILEVAQSMMIPVSETPLFLLPTMTWPKVMEVLEGATEHKMGSIPVVDNAYDLRLLGSVPVDSLRFAKNTMEYHTCEAKRLRESTKYTVQISPPASVEGGKYTISLNLGTQVSENRESWRLIAETLDPVWREQFDVGSPLQFCNQSFVFRTLSEDPSNFSPTSSMISSSADSDCEDFQNMSFSSEFSLGGTNRKVATAAMGRNKRLRIPPAELKDAVLQFSKNLLLIPVQVPPLEPFSACHRLFTSMSMSEACVCHFGRLVGILTKQRIVDAMHMHNSWRTMLF